VGKGVAPADRLPSGGHRRHLSAEQQRLPIHEGLVGQRALVGTPYLSDARLRHEYDTSIAPRTRAALGKILDEIAPCRRMTRPYRLLDLGAGTGAATDAFRAHFDGNIAVVAVDQVAAPGVITADLERFDVPPRVEGRFDYIVAAHVLNELGTRQPPADRIAARARKVQAWCSRLLDDGGTLILLEPALRETSRELLAVRDLIVAAGLVVVAPCLWMGPCPALGKERDWCHDTATRPDVKGAAARVDFSYLVVRAHGDPEPTTTDPTLFRIVSEPLAEKGRLRLYGCGPSGRQPLVRLHRHVSDANASFADLQRGDVARLRCTTFARDGLRVTAETTVTRLSPPDP
jgi:hypothetical protein